MHLQTKPILEIKFRGILYRIRNGRRYNKEYFVVFKIMIIIVELKCFFCLLIYLNFSKTVCLLSCKWMNQLSGFRQINETNLSFILLSRCEIGSDSCGADISITYFFRKCILVLVSHPFILALTVNTRHIIIY